MQLIQAAASYWKSRQASNKAEREALCLTGSIHPCILEEIGMREKCEECIRERLQELGR